ncbi:hypothetical protein F4778DRAFT_729049 [Xylariomycetidae sp. FL2044]|nr:hypothetical protein F4778DRAFT_729049 [Xylariomycetidae sp. FL2044]
MLVSRRNAPWASGVNDYLYAWGHGDDPDSFYALLKVPSPFLQKSRPIRPLHDSSPIRLIYDIGGARLGQHASAIWRVGDAYFKVKYTQWTLPKPMPREHTVLAALRNHPEVPLSFSYPKALYNAEYNDRYYLITTAVPGSTVRNAWPAIDKTAKQRCAQNVASICRELASWRSDRMGFVDGTPNEKLATWLNFGKADFADNAPEKLVDRGDNLGMDFSYFVFFHGDMGPTNVLVDRNNNDSIGLVD